jgi:hypothetical protein
MWAARTPSASRTPTASSTHRAFCAGDQQDCRVGVVTEALHADLDAVGGDDPFTRWDHAGADVSL